MGPFCSREAPFSHPFTRERAHISRTLARSGKLLHIPLVNASSSRVQCAYKNFLVQYPIGISLKCVHQLQIFDYSVINHALDAWQIKSIRMREEDS
jgi:hypothetical protein